MAKGLMYWLMINYVCIAIAYLIQGDYARVLYFVSALGISWAILVMQ